MTRRCAGPILGRMVLGLRAVPYPRSVLISKALGVAGVITPVRLRGRAGRRRRREVRAVRLAEHVRDERHRRRRAFMLPILHPGHLLGRWPPESQAQ